MNELVCVHRWQFLTRYEKETGEPFEIRKCDGLCKSVWRTDVPEPRVVLGRIEDGHKDA